jgi:hypothetical protein
VDLGRQEYRAVAAVEIAPGGTVVHLVDPRLQGGLPRGGIGYWATDDLAMGELTRPAHAGRCWAVENDHRGLTPCCGAERAQIRAARAQRNHIGLAIRALLRLEHHFSTTGVSWYEARARIIRGAVRAYIAKPMSNLT